MTVTISVVTAAAELRTWLSARPCRLISPIWFTIPPSVLTFLPAALGGFLFGDEPFNGS